MAARLILHLSDPASERATVSGEPSATIDGPLALRRGLAEIRDCQEELQSFSSGLVKQLEACAAELLRCQQAWLAERSEMERDLDRRAEAGRRQRAELAAEWEQLARVRQDLAAAREEFRRQQDEAARLAPPTAARTADAEKLLREFEAERRRDLQELRRLFEAVRAMRLQSAKPAATSLDASTTRLGIPKKKSRRRKN
jgi:DNA repair exonuclease SbcCD ATPase subunit